MNNKKKIGFTAAIILAALFSSSAAVHSVKQAPLYVFVSAFFMWTSYLTAHRISEGTFVDGHEEDTESEMIPRNREKWPGLILGLGIHISGFIVAIIGLRQQSLLLTMPGAILFWTGYIVAHYKASGKLL